MVITREQAVELINESNGRIFSVTFVKKDGSVREMVARLGVKKHLKGGSLGYNPKDFDLITVFDFQKKDYRSIQTKTLSRLRLDGVDMEVRQT